MHERLGLHESVLSQLVEIEMELEQIGTGEREGGHTVSGLEQPDKRFHGNRYVRLHPKWSCHTRGRAS